MLRVEQVIATVKCPTCRAPVESHCVNSAGKVLPLSQTHQRRWAVAKKRLKDMVTEKINTLPGLNEPGTEPIDTPESGGQARSVEEFFAATRVEHVPHRAKRLDAVLFGIHFARNIMGMRQEELDRRLAEMIVDGNHDVKEF